MPTNESEVDLLARAMIERYGLDAARSAVVRLNQMIDRGDWDGRDRWACVVRVIHESQGVGAVFARRERENARLGAARLA